LLPPSFGEACFAIPCLTAEWPSIDQSPLACVARINQMRAGDGPVGWSMCISRPRQQAAASQGASKLAHSKDPPLKAVAWRPPWFGEACVAD
jgi:hypothetical protein